MEQLFSYQHADYRVVLSGDTSTIYAQVMHGDIPETDPAILGAELPLTAHFCLEACRKLAGQYQQLCLQHAPVDDRGVRSAEFSRRFAALCLAVRSVDSRITKKEGCPSSGQPS